jgi:NADPH:quinone reductase-like Zn-dependent oxidoreductase
MRAIAINGWGGRDKLEIVDVEPPPVAPDGVLVRVRAAGLNPVDWKTREGRQAERFPYHFPLILGWDAAGVVEKVGPAVTWFKPGDEVFGMVRRHDLQYGTYAEYTTAPEGFFAHKPESQSFEEAAAMPLAALTAHQGLEALGLRGGETLFVGAGSGGVGHFAIQLAAARGARVIASASERNQDFLRELGAEPVDYGAGDVSERVRELSPDGGVDAAFDVFGGDEQARAMDLLRRGGRIVSIATPPEPREHIEVHYIFVRPTGWQLGDLADMVTEGSLRVHVEDTFPLERAADAMERLETGRVRGKLVLTVE